jgi:ATP-binding cassette subfamily B (MDR/TAP) protein 1
LGKVLSLNKPEFIFIAFGCLGSIFIGGAQPGFSIVLSKTLSVFQICDVSEQQTRITLYCLLFFFFGCITFLANILQVIIK